MSGMSGNCTMFILDQFGGPGRNPDCYGSDRHDTIGGGFVRNLLNFTITAAVNTDKTMQL